MKSPDIQTPKDEQACTCDGISTSRKAAATKKTIVHKNQSEDEDKESESFQEIKHKSEHLDTEI